MAALPPTVRVSLLFATFAGLVTLALVAPDEPVYQAETTIWQDASISADAAKDGSETRLTRANVNPDKLREQLLANEAMAPIGAAQSRRNLGSKLDLSVEPANDHGNLITIQLRGETAGAAAEQCQQIADRYVQRVRRSNAETQANQQAYFQRLTELTDRVDELQDQLDALLSDHLANLPTDLNASIAQGKGRIAYRTHKTSPYGYYAQQQPGLQRVIDGLRRPPYAAHWPVSDKNKSPLPSSTSPDSAPASEYVIRDAENLDLPTLRLRRAEALRRLTPQHPYIRYLDELIRRAEAPAEEHPPAAIPSAVEPPSENSAVATTPETPGSFESTEEVDTPAHDERQALHAEFLTKYDRLRAERDAAMMELSRHAKQHPRRAGASNSSNEGAVIVVPAHVAQEHNTRIPGSEIWTLIVAIALAALMAAVAPFVRRRRLFNAREAEQTVGPPAYDVVLDAENRPVRSRWPSVAYRGIQLVTLFLMVATFVVLAGDAGLRREARENPLVAAARAVDRLLPP